MFIPEFTGSGSGHFSPAEITFLGSQPDVATARLYRSGEKIAASEEGAWGDIEVPAGNADCRLDLTTARDPSDWAYGASTRTSWSFRSDTTTSESRLPLLQLDYDVPVDTRNAVSRAAKHTLGLSVRMQDGMAQPRGVHVTVEASYDGGRSWAAAVSARKGSGYTAAVERPAHLRGNA
ncbi:hypothetical protein [Streptomyces pseudogriseolus]|uniref:hypothetical protein n=1 Tax=Streptomyces pseudogriseolus TaxID=36817 RepID=UPI001CE3468A|nr:hypothetical protein [Streptomyces pseudogriseolus]